MTTAELLILLGLAIAAVVAWCNATSSAQLAAVHPQSGGTYVYGRARLGPAWGFLAGWGFVVGKTASCAAMALTFATYAADWIDTWPLKDQTRARYRGILRRELLPVFGPLPLAPDVIQWHHDEIASLPPSATPQLSRPSRPLQT